MHMTCIISHQEEQTLLQAKLIIRDEVNVKIEGLELTTRKKLVDRF